MAKNILFPGKEGILTPYIFITDHLGSVRAVVNLAAGTVAERDDYMAYGTTVPNATDSTAFPRLATNIYGFSGKEELNTTLSVPNLDFGARLYDPFTASWLSPDPLAADYPGISPYAYCAGDPMNLVDPNGRAWRQTFFALNNGSRVPNGYEWVDENASYDENGNLLDGLYHQAIFFSDNGNFNSESNNNIGSSTAYVYLADGSIVTFGATTYPSDINNYPTVPEGFYIADVGKHKGKYFALKMRDIGSNKGEQRIQLGMPNPAHPDRDYAEGINIHKPGSNNLTSKTTDGRPISAGCLLIDINRWEEFIGHFNNSEQKSNVVGVAVSRSQYRPDSHH